VDDRPPLDCELSGAFGQAVEGDVLALKQARVAECDAMPVGCVNTISLQKGQVRTADEFTHPTRSDVQNDPRVPVAYLLAEGEVVARDRLDERPRVAEVSTDSRLEPLPS
jgi:hypothetical protein